jgi:recombination protein RecA
MTTSKTLAKKPTKARASKVVEKKAGPEAARHRHVQKALGDRDRLVKERERIVAKIRKDKRFGAEAITSFAERVVPRVECVRTGFGHLDDLLTGEARMGSTIPGSGLGIPKGRIVELAGKEGSSKTTLLLELIAAFQKLGLKCGLIDTEHAVDFTYAQAIGVDRDLLLYDQPDSAEQALDLMLEFVRLGVDFVALDSVAALLPEAEAEGGMGDSQVGLQARLMSKAMKKMKGAIAKSGCVVVLVNQKRQAIGAFSRFGPPPEKTTGGNALRFYADIRLDAAMIRTIKKGTKTYGGMVKLKCIKNKLAAPFREVFLETHYGEGIVHIHPSDDSSAGMAKEETGA